MPSDVAKHWGIPQWFTDIDELIAKADCDVVDICLPNFLHHRATVAAARAGKHVIVEKPLSVTLEEADDMIAVCREHGRKLMYAEELCFAPKYERIRHLAKEGAVGDIYMLKQLEKHSGPHSDWFWNVDQSGGGVMMDMGCHAFGWFRWMLGGAPVVKSVWATMDTVRHKARTRGEDNSVCVVEFENGVIGPGRGQLGEAGRHGRSHRGLRIEGRIVCRSLPRQRRIDLQRGRLQLRRRKGRFHSRAGRSRSSRKCSIRAIRTSCSTSSGVCAKTKSRSLPVKTAVPCSR